MTTINRPHYPACRGALRSFSIGLAAGALLALGIRKRAIRNRIEWSGGDATAELRATDGEMETVFQNILVRCLADPSEHSEQAVKLSEAQKAWAAYRDAHIAAIYPEGGEHGKVAELREAIIRADLTRERTRQLREWWE